MRLYKTEVLPILLLTLIVTIAFPARGTAVSEAGQRYNLMRFGCDFERPIGKEGSGVYMILFDDGTFAAFEWHFSDGEQVVLVVPDQERYIIHSEDSPSSVWVEVGGTKVYSPYTEAVAQTFTIAPKQHGTFDPTKYDRLTIAGTSRAVIGGKGRADNVGVQAPPPQPQGDGVKLSGGDPDFRLKVAGKVIHEGKVYDKGFRITFAVSKSNRYFLRIWSVHSSLKAYLNDRLVIANLKDGTYRITPDGVGVKVNEQHRSMLHHKLIACINIRDTRDNLCFYFPNPSSAPLDVRKVLLDGKDLKEMVKEGKLLWFDVVPNPVPSGDWAELRVRFKGKATLGPEVKLTLIDAKGGRYEWAAKVRKPGGRAVSYCFSDNLSTLHLWLKGMEGIRRVFVGSWELTSGAIVKPVRGLGFCLLTVHLPRPLKEGEYKVVRVEAPQGMVACLVRAMKPFFVIGMYRVQEDRPRFLYAPPKEEWLKDCAEAGVNTVAPDYISARGDPDLLSKYGLKLVTYNPPKGLTVEQFSRHPALLAWYVVDEPLLGRVNPMGLVKRAENFRRNDPKHYLVITHWDGALLAEFNFFDEAWFDFYPVTWLSLLRTMRRHLKGCVEMLPPKPVRFVAQAFMGGGVVKGGKRKAYGKRFPTPGELRLMVYQCLGWGLKGVIYFAYSIEPREPVYGVGLTKMLPPSEAGKYPGLGKEQIEQAKRLWEGMKELNAELKRIGSLLLSGASIPLAECSDKRVQVHTVLSAEGKVVLFALNTDFEYTPEKFVPHPRRRVHIAVRLPDWIKTERAWRVTADGLVRLEAKRKGRVLEVVLDNLRDACAIIIG